jgi:hypothetical protein
MSITENSRALRCHSANLALIEWNRKTINSAYGFKLRVSRRRHSNHFYFGVFKIADDQTLTRD